MILERGYLISESVQESVTFGVQMGVEECPRHFLQEVKEHTNWAL